MLSNYIHIDPEKILYEMPFEKVMMYIYSIPKPKSKNEKKTLDLSNDPRATLELFKGL